MPNSISSSMYYPLESLPHNVLAVNSSGIILFSNRNWDSYNTEYGLFTLKNWVGADYSTLMQSLSILPDQWVQLYKSIQRILHGEDLVFSSEFFIHTAKKGDRVFRLEVFPLIVDYPSTKPTFVISHFDVGPFTRFSYYPQNDLTPICASCKSIRNTKEQWVMIEQYLQQQYSLQFTHDICPDCISQLYPKYAGAFERYKKK